MNPKPDKIVAKMVGGRDYAPNNTTNSMPKFIGHREHTQNRPTCSLSTEEQKRLVKISYAQKILLPQNQVFFALDTSDRGGPKSLAKRWNRWFALPETLANSQTSTDAMRKAGMSAKLHLIW